MEKPECPNCHCTTNVIRSGSSANNVRWRCTNCNRYFTGQEQFHHTTSREKEMIISMSSEGVDMRKIARIVGKSHVAVYKLLKDHFNKMWALYQDFCKEIKNSKLAFAYIIIDEIWIWVGKKSNKKYVWTAKAVTRFGQIKHFFHISHTNGVRGLLDLLDLMPVADHYFSDGNRAYTQVLGDRVTAQKSSITNLIESFNAMVREYISKLARRTKGFAKSLTQLEHHTASVFLAKNWL